MSNNKNGIIARILKNGGNKSRSDSPPVREIISRTEVHHAKNRPKNKGSRRRCISPEVRRRMENHLVGSDTVRSAPADYEGEKKQNYSVKSDPTADVPFVIKVADGKRLRPARSTGQIHATIENRKRNTKPKDSSNLQHIGRRHSADSDRGRDKAYRPEKMKEKDDDAFRMKSLGKSLPNKKKDYPKSVGMMTSQTMDSQILLFRRKSHEVKSNVKVPEGKITIVITDVESSTKLWEVDAVAMKEALDLHDSVLRKCYTNHNGYEITTEGDSFHLAFHHPLDALSFALQAQIDLYNAKWPSSILSIKNAGVDRKKILCGLRVRMGIHHGETISYKHEITHRTYYKGEAMNYTKAIESMSHGGQILTTVETWRAVSGMAERYLGSPQVLDCGEHKLDDDATGPLKSQKLVQLVPKRFAYDYFTWRGMKGTPSRDEEEGRRFPPLKSKKKLNTCFNDAPYKDNEVVVVFVYTVTTMENLCEEANANNITLLSKYIRFQLLSCNPPGYECQEANGQWMLVFHTLSSAIIFGVKIAEKLENAPLKVKVGIQSGSFTSQGPHAVTGRADYFGPVVNRAARIASSGENGQVLLGVTADQVDDIKLPTSNTFKLNYLRCAQFKGMSMVTTVYDCCKNDEVVAQN
jgi:class 3 adenylate cyclase